MLGGAFVLNHKFTPPVANNSAFVAASAFVGTFT